VKKVRRTTKETDIIVEIGKKGEIKTNDLILDHMLTAFAFYLGKDMRITATYDLRHHLWEDIGITLGEALRENLPEKFTRFGNAIMPMDDALVLVSVDISNRPYANVDVNIKDAEEGFAVSLLKEFVWGLARGLRATIHIKQLSGENAHHIVEAAFKGLGMALRVATKESERVESTKGVL